MMENYDSVYSFVNAITAAQPNAAFKKVGIRESETASAEYSGTENMEQANSLLEKGYAEGCNAIMHGSVSLKLGNEPKMTRKTDRVGGSPHIVNAIMGRPKNMIRTIRNSQPVKLLKIYYDLTANASIDKDVLFRGGANMYAFVKYLESHGIRVELHCLLTTASKRSHRVGTIRVGVCSVKVKDAQQQLNPMLMSYPVTHPSFLRRHCLRWIETSRCTDDDSFVFGYGYALRGAIQTDMLEYIVKHCEPQQRSRFKDAVILNVEEMARAEKIEDVFKNKNIKLN